MLQDVPFEQALAFVEAVRVAAMEKRANPISAVGNYLFGAGSDTAKSISDFGKSLGNRTSAVMDYITGPSAEHGRKSIKPGVQADTKSRQQVGLFGIPEAKIHAVLADGSLTEAEKLERIKQEVPGTVTQLKNVPAAALTAAFGRDVLPGVTDAVGGSVPETLKQLDVLGLKNLGSAPVAATSASSYAAAKVLQSFQQNRLLRGRLMQGTLDKDYLSEHIDTTLGDSGAGIKEQLMRDRAEAARTGKSMPAAADPQKLLQRDPAVEKVLSDAASRPQGVAAKKLPKGHVNLEVSPEKALADYQARAAQAERMVTKPLLDRAAESYKSRNPKAAPLTSNHWLASLPSKAVASKWFPHLAALAPTTATEWLSSRGYRSADEPLRKIVADNAKKPVLRGTEEQERAAEDDLRRLIDLNLQHYGNKYLPKQ